MEIRTTSRGKPLLCLDGYEYVRDGIKGERIYWKCACHEQIKCSGRASCAREQDGSPNGARRTVEHNHPPNPKRRIPLELVRTEMMRVPLLEYDGFSYIKDRESGCKTYWKCIKEKCLGGVVSTDSVNARLISDHNHSTSDSPCSKCKEAKKQKQEVNLAGTTSKCELKKCNKYIHISCAEMFSRRLFCCTNHKDIFMKQEKRKNEESSKETRDCAQAARQTTPIQGTAEDSSASSTDESEESSGQCIESADSSESNQGSDISNIGEKKQHKTKVPCIVISDDEGENAESGDASPVDADFKVQLPCLSDLDVSVPLRLDSRKRKQSTVMKDREETSRCSESKNINNKEEAPICSKSKKTEMKISQNLQDSQDRHQSKTSAQTHQIPSPNTENSSLALDSYGEAAEWHDKEASEHSDNSVGDSHFDITSVGRQVSASAMDLVCENPGTHQTNNVRDSVAASCQETKVKRSGNQQSQSQNGPCTHRQDTENDDPERDLRHEYLESEIRKNNIITEKAQKKMVLMEEERRRKEERQKWEQNQHVALMEKIQKETALMEERKRREEEQHDALMGKIKKEMTVIEEQRKREYDREMREIKQHDAKLDKLQREMEQFKLACKKMTQEMTLMEERQKKEEEKSKRTEESQKMQKRVYIRETNESRIREAYYRNLINNDQVS